MWLSVAVKYIKLSWRIFLANFASALSFRVSFILYIAGIVIFYSGQFFLWSIFFNQFPMVGGYTTKDVILAYSLFVFSLSVLDVFMGGIGDLAQIINAGGLDYYLAFPKPILWHVAVSKADISSIGSLFLSLVFFILSCPFDPVRLLLFLLASCFTMVLLLNFMITIQSIAFFVGGFDKGASMPKHLLAMVSPYPFRIFPQAFGYLLITIIPSFFVITLPAQLVDHFSFSTIGILLCACIISSCISSFVFKKGLKRYESGNLVNVRM